MEDSVAIRLHGRGGQGAVTLAALLVDSGFRAGWHAVGFPTFGTERTGAPVAAFVRLSRQPILDRSEIRTPSIVVVQDPTLITAVNVADGLVPGGLILLNAASAPAELSGQRVIAVPVTEIAVRHLGSAILSTAMLGFFAAATGLVDIESVCAAIRDRFRAQIATRNEALAREAFAAAAEGRAA